MWSIASLLTILSDAKSGPPHIHPRRCIRLYHKHAVCDGCVAVCPVHSINVGRPGSAVTIDEGCLHCDRCVAVCPVDVFQRRAGTEKQWLQALLSGVSTDGVLCLYCQNLNTRSRRDRGVALQCHGSLHSAALLFLLISGVRVLELRFGNCCSCLLGGGWEQLGNWLSSLQKTLYRHGLPLVEIEEQESSIFCLTKNPAQEKAPRADRRALLKQAATLAGRMVATTFRAEEHHKSQAAVFEPEQAKHNLYFRALAAYRDLSGGSDRVTVSSTVRIIDQGLCNGCGLCVKLCRNKALVRRNEEVPFFDGSRCTDCGLCLTACRSKAIRREDC